MSRPVTPLILLSWAIGLFAFILGIIHFSAWNSDGATFGRSVASFFGKTSSSASLIFAIGEIIIGVIMVLAPLGLLKPGANQALLVIAAIFWIVRGVFALFIDESPFHPSALIWLQTLAWYLILILASWEVRRNAS